MPNKVIVIVKGMICTARYRNIPIATTRHRTYHYLFLLFAKEIHQGTPLVYPTVDIIVIMIILSVGPK